MTRKALLPESKQLSERFGQGLLLASELHRDQLRKGTAIPYVSHLLAVASLVIEAGGDEDQAIAARFGARVLRIVEACTDDVSDQRRTAANWRLRKERYLAHLKRAPEEVLLVSCADKLHNARAIARDLEVQGEAIWGRFNVGREETLWYYEALVETFEPRGIEPQWLVEVLARAVERMKKR